MTIGAEGVTMGTRENGLITTAGSSREEGRTNRTEVGRTNRVNRQRKLQHLNRRTTRKRKLWKRKYKMMRRKKQRKVRNLVVGRAVKRCYHDYRNLDHEI